MNADQRENYFHAVIFNRKTFMRSIGESIIFVLLVEGFALVSESEINNGNFGDLNLLSSLWLTYYCSQLCSNLRSKLCSMSLLILGQCQMLIIGG